MVMIISRPYKRTVTHNCPMTDLMGNRVGSEGPMQLGNRKNNKTLVWQIKLHFQSEHLENKLPPGNPKGLPRCSELGGEQNKPLNPCGLPPRDHMLYFDWRLQTTAYLSHTHGRMVWRGARLYAACQGRLMADSAHFSPSFSRFLGHLTAWRKRKQSCGVHHSGLWSCQGWWTVLRRGVTRRHSLVFTHPITHLRLAADTTSKKGIHRIYRPAGPTGGMGLQLVHIRLPTTVAQTSPDSLD